jgi:Ca2+-binding EF-hand superfamily protein
MLTILDIQKVPFNVEEDIKNRSSKINRMLKKHFNTKENFARHLKSNVDVDKNGTIDLNEFQLLIINTLKDEIENSEVGKKDVESFLSNFIYNKYGHTAIEEVAPRVFASVEEYNRIIDHFRRPKPAPSKVNHGLMEGSEQHLGDKFYQQRIKTLADKIVDKAILTSTNKFQCFKSFDCDDDGYISYQDFVKKVNLMEIKASNNEIVSVAKSLDPDKNGFIDYSHFQQYFTPNLPEITENTSHYLINKKAASTINGSNVPNSEFLRNQISRSKSSNSKMMSITNGFKAASDIQMNLKPTNRFSATPQWKNTFTHYHQDPTSSAFMSESDRFKKTTNSLHVKNDFQVDDKSRKNTIAESKISRKRQVFGAFDERAYNNDVFADNFEQNKLNHKAAISQNYERICHSRVI